MKLLQWLRELFGRRSGDGRAPSLPPSSPESPKNSTAAQTTTAPAAGSTTNSGGGLLIRDPALVFRTLHPLDPKRVRHVVIHHTSNSNPRWGVAECHKSHIARGWSGIGYHYFIEQDGAVYYGRADAAQDWIGAHVEGHNSTSVGICLDGNYSVQYPTIDNLNVVARVAAMLLRRYKLKAEAIRYHSQLANKDCPGRNFEKIEDFRRRVISRG